MKTKRFHLLCSGNALTQLGDRCRILNRKNRDDVLVEQHLEMDDRAIRRARTAPEHFIRKRRDAGQRFLGELHVIFISVENEFIRNGHKMYFDSYTVLRLIFDFKYFFLLM